MKHFDRTWHLRIDTDIVRNIIDKNQDKFFCPFSNTESYLNIYKDRECAVQFLNLHECDYSRESNRDGSKYIRYLTSVERKLGNTDIVDFLNTNQDKFTVETNEENFVIPSDDQDVKKLLSDLNSMWAFDSDRIPTVNICRARIVKLPAGGTMPYHRDETASKNMRVICPIITHHNIKNAFRDSDGESLYNFKSTGHFYTFEEDKIEHAVFNNSDVDRYALIFTVINVQNLKEWDRAFKRYKMYWEAWGRAF
jgi:hypothetical protein